MTKHPRLRRAVAVLLPLLLVMAALPASGLLGGLSGVASEITQILNVAENAFSAVESAAAVVETAKAVAELQQQYDEMVDQAMGRVGALVQRFEDLSSDPMSLLDNAGSVSWSGDFTGQPLQLLNAFADMQDASGNSLLTWSRQAHATADTVSRQRYARTFRDNPHASDQWLERRERADAARAADYLVLDSAEKTIELLGSASDSVERSRRQTALADTALAQERHANQLTEIEVDISVAQLIAHHAARDMLAQRQLEIEHQEQIEAWVNAERAEDQRARRAQNRVRGHRNAWRTAFLFN
jgi:hypothetical protein